MSSLQDLLAVRRPLQQQRAASLSVPAPAPTAPPATHLVLPPELTAASVPALRVALLEWAAQHGPGQAWCLNAAQVQTVDAAGLQLLLSLASRAAARYVRLRFFDPSAELCRVCAALGLDGVLLETPDNTELSPAVERP